MAIGTTAAIALGVGALGAGAQIISGSKAAKAQENAAKAASDVQLQLFDKASTLVEPFVSTGTDALGLLNDIFIKGQTNKILEMPGFDFLQSEGEKAINRAHAASGDFLSGSRMKDLVRWNQDLASTKWQSFVAPVFDLANLGENAATFTGQGAIRTGQGVANTTLAAGNAQAAGYANVGSAINNFGNNALFSLMMQGGVPGSSPYLSPTSNLNTSNLYTPPGAIYPGG